MCSNIKNSYLTDNSKNYVNTTENHSININNNIINENDYKNYEDLFVDEEVQRFDADSYRQKYGDKWKKLATTVRDVIQPDGTIIREYVIEDPSLLEQLSEDDDNLSNVNNNNNINNDNNNNNNNNINNDNHNINNNDKFDNQQNSKCFKESKNVNKTPFNNIFNYNYYSDKNSIYNIDNNSKIEKSNNDSINIINKQSITKSAVEINKYFQPIQSNTTQPKLTNFINSTPNMQILGHENQISSTNNNNNNSQSPNTPLTNITPLNFTNKSSSSTSSSNSTTIRLIKDEENDKEVEKIHEQGKQFENLDKFNQQIDECSEYYSQVEYEILDENGNQIMIGGAEKLKQLAACVNEIRQKDGSIVKEYILNDPKIIEHIKSQIKTNNSVQQEIVQEKNMTTLTACRIDNNDINNKKNHFQVLNDQNHHKEIPTNKTNSDCNIDNAINMFNRFSNISEQMKNMKTISQNGEECNYIEKIVSPITQMRVSNNEKGFQYNRKQQIDNNQTKAPWENKNYSLQSASQSEILLTNKQHSPIQNQQKSKLNLIKQPSEENVVIKPLSGVALASATSNKINELASINNQFIGQVQQKIQKFQQQQQAQKQTNNIKKNIEKKIVNTPNSFNSITSPKNSNQNRKFNNNENNNEKIEDNLIKHINRNQFELRTKKGKALQFTITSDDPSESDIEEVKSILNKRFSCFEQSSSSNKNVTNLKFNGSNTNLNKTTFQPNNSNNNSASITKSSPINQQHIITKSGSMANFLSNQEASNEQSKDYQNDKLDSNRSLNYLKYLSHSKSISNIASSIEKENENIEEKANIISLNNYEEIGEQKLFIYNNNATMSSISSSNLIENRPITQIKTNNTKMNPFKSMSNLNKGSTLSLDNLENLNENKNDNSKNWYESNHLINKPRVDGNTYTKNTPIKLEANESNNSVGEEPKNSIYMSKNLNRSLNQLDDRGYVQNRQKNIRNVQITPEMTEKLLLKLLLQQITNQTPNKLNSLNNMQNFSDYSSNQLTQSKYSIDSLNKIGDHSTYATNVSAGSTLKINLNNNINNNIAKKNLTQKSTNNLDLNNGSLFNQLESEIKRYSSIEIENQNRCSSNSSNMINNNDLSNNNIENKRFYY